jgi:hypothetical protein
MPGVIFHMRQLAPVLIAGAKMVSLVYPTTINVSAFLSLYGMAKIQSSRKGSSALLAIKAIMAKMPRNSTTTSIQLQRTHT